MRIERRDLVCWWAITLLATAGVPAAAATEGATVEENKLVVQRYVERFNAGDLEGLRGVFASDAEVRGVLGWGAVDAVMPIWRQLIEALADCRPGGREDSGGGS